MPPTAPRYDASGGLTDSRLTSCAASPLRSHLGFCSLHSHCDSIFPRGCKFLNCGSKFSHVAASFQLAGSTRDKMKSCRHKRYRHLILNWFRAGGGDLIGRRRGIQRQGETDRQKSVRLENAARHRNRTVSPDGVHPTRAGMYPQILLRRLFQRAVSATGKSAPQLQKPRLSVQNATMTAIAAAEPRWSPATTAQRSPWPQAACRILTAS